MKFGFLILFVGLCVMEFQCGTSKKLTYNYPTDLSPDEMQRLEVRVEKGKKLFKQNCSGCHGIFGKGKDSVVNFSKKQIDSYTTSFIKGDYKNHAFASGLTNEELTDILLFAYLVKIDK